MILCARIAASLRYAKKSFWQRRERKNNDNFPILDPIESIQFTVSSHSKTSAVAAVNGVHSREHKRQKWDVIKIHHRDRGKRIENKINFNVTKLHSIFGVKCVGAMCVWADGEYGFEEHAQARLHQIAIIRNMRHAPPSSATESIIRFLHMPNAKTKPDGGRYVPFVRAIHSFGGRWALMPRFVEENTFHSGACILNSRCRTDDNPTKPANGCRRWGSGSHSSSAQKKSSN